MNGEYPDLSFCLSDIHSDAHRTVTINNTKEFSCPKSFPYLLQKSVLKCFEQEGGGVRRGGGFLFFN